MSYGLWELASLPQMQERIRQELQTVIPLSEIGQSDNLENLILFNAFLKETLRRWPTLPGPLERITPPEGLVIKGIFIPGGVSLL